MDKPADAERAKLPELGARLRARRKAAELTLKELSARSGVSISMLSQIERGQTNPTFATVWRLTSTLGISVEALVERASPEAGVGQVSTIRKLKSHQTPIMRSDDGGCEVRVLNPLRPELPVEWYEMRFRPRSELVSEPHPAGAVEHLTVLEGSVTVRSGDDRSVAVSGDTLRYPADRPHVIANPGDAPAAVVVVVLYGARV